MAGGQDDQAGPGPADQVTPDQIVVSKAAVPPVAPPRAMVAWRAFLVLVVFMGVVYLSIAVFAVSTYPSLRDFPLGTLFDLRQARAEWLVATKELGQTFVLTPLMPLLGAVLGYLFGPNGGLSQRSRPMRAWFADGLGRWRRHLSRFEIPGFTNVTEICAGGFSTIYRADQPRFGRTVAVKVLHMHGLAKHHLRARFERECEVLGMLGGHPNVVSVFDAAIDKSGCPYIVMEYVRAGSFADRLDADGPLPWGEVLEIGVKLAGTLESAHQAGVLHLDMKPANVLRGPNGEPKLADFGIARVRAALGTTTQTLIFTVGYVPPERFEGGESTPASDIYGLGATLFTLLVGHSPFLRSRNEEPRPEVILGRQLFEPEPELNGDAPESLGTVIRRAMSKRPGERFGSAAELGQALQAVQRQEGLAVTPLLIVPIAPITPKAPPHRRRPRLVVACIPVVLALIAGLLVLRPWRQRCAPETVRADGVLSFGTLLPKSGQFVYQGPAMEAGVQLAIQDIDAAGGIPRVNVQLDESNQRDSGDGASTGIVHESTDALLSAGVDVIIGPGTSAGAREVIDDVVCAGVVMFAASNTAAMFSTYRDRGLYFRTSPLSVEESSVLGRLVVDDGNSTAVVMSRNDVYANGLRREVEQAIEGSGGTVLDSFRYDPDRSGYSAEVRRAKAKNPDAIVLIGFTDTARILAEMIKQGLGPQRKHVYGVTGNMSNTLAGQVNPGDPSVVAGMKGTALATGSEAFARRLQELEPGLRDLEYGPQAYDAVVITALAAIIAGTDAPAGIARQINGVTRGGVKCTSYADCMRLVQERKDIDYDGASGALEFTRAGEPSSSTYLVCEIQADGSVKPFRVAQGGTQPVFAGAVRWRCPPRSGGR